jgi:hypothetical protein
MLLSYWKIIENVEYFYLSKELDMTRLSCEFSNLVQICSIHFPRLALLFSNVSGGCIVMAVSNLSIINSNAEWLLDFHTSNVMQNAIPAEPWLRLLVPSLSLRRPGSVRVGFVMDKVAEGQVFLPSSSLFPCQYHSTEAAHSYII